jgi:hypothetical protein
MIQELRIYTLAPGVQPAFLAHAQNVAMSVRGNRYGRLEGYWTSEFGTLNQVFQLWSFTDLHERARLLGELSGVEEWTQRYLPQARSMILSQETSILAPTLPIDAPPQGPNLYELRRYTTHPGKASEWLALIKQVAPARRALSPIVGVWGSELGALNQVLHLWAYRDLNHRASVRKQAAQDPAWRDFVSKVPPLLTRMESTILAPAAFSPLN